MSWRAIQNKNRHHKDTFQKELGQVQYESFTDENLEFYRFLYSLFIKITEELPSKSEKEWADMMKYMLEDLGFEIESHDEYLNCFILQTNQICILSKSPNPLLLFRFKHLKKSILVLSPQNIKEYIFQEDGCLIKQV